MDRKRSLLNISVSMFFYLVNLVLSFFTRRLFISVLGIGVNGLNSLFQSIIGFLAIAELGAGAAISYSMYEPIVQGDDEKVSSLYNLYARVYRTIGLIIFLCGLCILPFLKYIINDYYDLEVNVQINFLIYLLATVFTYFYNEKISLLNAYKENYVTSFVTSVAKTLCQIFQIISLVLYRKFEFYLACKVLSSIFECILINIIVNKSKNKIISNKNINIDHNTFITIKNNILAMFLHKIGALLSNTVDSIVVSVFLGVAILGRYSNYILVVSSMSGLLDLFFTPLTSLVGHMCVEKSKKTSLNYLYFFHSFNFLVGVVFFLGYFMVATNLITILFGTDTELNQTIVMFITLDHFIKFFKRSIELFRDATGTFYMDRYRPLIEGLINLALSVSILYALPNEYKIVGVILSTIITNLFICDLIEPTVIFKYYFNISPKTYIIKNYIMIISFSLCLFSLSLIKFSMYNLFTETVIKGLISIFVSLIVSLLLLLIDENFKDHFIVEAAGLFKKCLKWCKDNK